MVNLLQAVLIQLIAIFGIFFILGYILSQLQAWTQENYLESFGWRGILWTAWIGTPIHELGHLFFAIIFKHKISRVSLFRPDQATGQLGDVIHAYNKRSIYQRIGNFFIGAGPMIFGCGALLALLYYLAPQGKETFLASLSGADIAAAIKQALASLFSFASFGSWQFWVWLYLSFAIASHLAPSQVDRKGMWRGLAWLVLLIVLVNAIIMIFGADVTGFVLSKIKYFSILAAIFLYAIAVSVSHLIFSYCLKALSGVIKARRFSQ